MIYVVLGLIGAVWGKMYLYGLGGALFGGLAGILAAAVIAQRNRIVRLEERLASLVRIVDSLRSQTATARAADGAAAGRNDPAPSPGEPARDRPGKTAPGLGPSPTPPADAALSPAAIPTAPAPADPVAEMPSLELELADAALVDAPAAGPKAPASPSSASRLAGMIRSWFTGGNLMVRVGVVVLLFGFAFLVKYAAARNMVPLEFRLAAAFAAGIGLLVLGWRLRGTRFGYAVTLQGGGIGVMYLTLFAAARLFHLVPMPLALIVMIGLVAFSGMLAVLQNAAVMAVIGAAGGFMAPVLLSTGTGSHVMLFSYYALLNAGVFGIAWFKAWRWLNLLGFCFTFGIGSAWGVQYYRPGHFATTEPFLILFFAFYLTIAVLFALRQPPRLKGYVDGPLVFGLPLVVFTLQTGLVRDMTHGLALSAVAMALVYTVLATALWRRRGDGLAPLVEAFLAMGVVFGSLAVPLALSGSWTAVAWSLEGAGLVWVGLRQDRRLARAFGLLLQIAAGVMFVHGDHDLANAAPVFNNGFLGAMMVAGAGLVSAWLLERHGDRLGRWEHMFPGAVLAWGLVWWFAGGLIEIQRTLPGRHEPAASFIFIALSALAMGFLYDRPGWKTLRIPAMGQLPVVLLAIAVCPGISHAGHPFQGWWPAVWPLLFAAHLFLLRRLEGVWGRLAAVWHLAGALAAIALLSAETAWLLDRIADGGGVWPFVAWGGIPALGGAVVSKFAPTSGRWPLVRWKTVYGQWLPMALTVGMFAWTIIGLGADGDTRPLPYLPLVNPLDLVQMGVFLVMVNVLAAFWRDPWVAQPPRRPEWIWGLPAAAGILWLTAVVARSVHHYAVVPYAWEVMFHSDLFHAAVAVLWGLIALAGMVAAVRYAQRPVWFAAAGLLAVVVVKLFVVDLSGSGTISRIVSFLAVGALLLVIGFFTPLPPAQPAPSKGSSR